MPDNRIVLGFVPIASSFVPSQITYFGVLVVIVFTVTSVEVRSRLTMEQCRVISDGTNKSLPAKIDPVFTAHSTRCDLLNGSLSLVYQIKTSSAQLDLQALRQHSVTYWCPDQKRKLTLRVMGVSHKYLQGSKGKVVGRNDIKSDDCPRFYRR